MKSEYNTKQKQILIDHLKNNPQKQFTIQQIAEEICAKSKIGKSTVYRLVSKLTDDGVIMRYMNDSNNKVVYQYVDLSKGCHHHFHLKCSDCGKTVHLENNDEEAAILNILSKNEFSMSENKTMLFGKCRNCK